MRKTAATKISVDGFLPKRMGISRAEVKAAAEYFAARSAKRVRLKFCEVTVILQNDAFSEEVHLAINGAQGPTDVVTQRYDALPGEDEGVYGELYVNCDRAWVSAPHRRGWSPAKELLLYIAHGMDHLSGADDLTAKGYARMRRRELGWLAAI